MSWLRLNRLLARYLDRCVKSLGGNNVQKPSLPTHKERIDSSDPELIFALQKYIDAKVQEAAHARMPYMTRIFIDRALKDLLEKRAVITVDFR